MFDIKTKRSIYTPKVESWEGTVPGYSEQEPDYFAFLNIKFAETTGKGTQKQFFRPQMIYFGGVISYEDYLEKRYYVKAGEKYSTNTDSAHISQWNIDWKDLKNISEIDLTN